MTNIFYTSQIFFKKIYSGYFVNIFRAVLLINLLALVGEPKRVNYPDGGNIFGRDGVTQNLNLGVF